MPLLFVYLFICLCIYHLVPAAAACVRCPAHDAGQYCFIHFIFIYPLVSAAAAYVRHPAAT
jgi:uncharacterized membrane protein YhaH (DUF805 family)